MFARTAAFLFAAAFAAPAAALCTGESMFDGLAPETRAEITAIAEADAYGEGVYWKAEKGDATIYLLGTVHMFDPVLEAVAEAALPQLTAADQVFFEMTEEEEARLQNLISSNPAQVVLPEPPSLDVRLGAEAWAVVERQLAQAGVPADQAKALQPWLVALMISVPACVLADTAAGKVGLDEMLRDEAMALGKPVTGLDNAEALLELMTGDPIDEQVEDFRLGLASGNFSADGIVTTQMLYRSQELRLLWETTRAVALEGAGERMAETQAAFDEMEAALLHDRNTAWTEALLANAEGQTLFVAVGSLHLIADFGLPALLADAGWTVERIPLPALDAAGQH